MSPALAVFAARRVLAGRRGPFFPRAGSARTLSTTCPDQRIAEGERLSKRLLNRQNEGRPT
jgi:hypothetical protein